MYSAKSSSKFCIFKVLNSSNLLYYLSTVKSHFSVGRLKQGVSEHSGKFATAIKLEICTIILSGFIVQGGKETALRSSSDFDINYFRNNLSRSDILLISKIRMCIFPGRSYTDLRIQIRAISLLNKNESLFYVYFLWIECCGCFRWRSIGRRRSV